MQKQIFLITFLLLAVSAYSSTIFPSGNPKADKIFIMFPEKNIRISIAEYVNLKTG